MNSSVVLWIRYRSDVAIHALYYQNDIIAVVWASRALGRKTPLSVSRCDSSRGYSDRRPSLRSVGSQDAALLLRVALF